MSLTQEQITRLAKLTALESDAAVSIDSVLDSFDAIRDTPVDAIEHMARSGNPSLILRPDTVNEDPGLPRALLAASPQRVAADQIVLAGIMQGE